MKAWHNRLEWAGFFSVLFCIWQAAATWVHNDMILPAPLQVLQTMEQQLVSPVFIPTVLISVGRVAAAVVLALGSGFLLAMLAHLVHPMEFFITRLLLLLRSIPNIAFIILMLFWMNREAAVLLVLWLLLVPIVYSALLERMEEISAHYKDVFRIYPQPWSVRLREAFFPELAGTWSAAVVTASSLACKAGVMAEILCQVPAGIGRSMQSARFALDTAGVMGWTIWLLLFAFALDAFWKRLPLWLERMQG